MIVKDGDVIEFIGLEWQEKHWEFDHPTVILSPIISYSPNGESASGMIEDMCIDLAINADDIEPKEMKDEDVSEEFKWRHWNLKTMKRVAKNLLEGKEDWKTKYPRVTKQKIRFYNNDGELEFEILEEIEA